MDLKATAERSAAHCFGEFSPDCYTADVEGLNDTSEALSLNAERVPSRDLPTTPHTYKS